MAGPRSLDDRARFDRLHSSSITTSSGSDSVPRLDKPQRIDPDGTSGRRMHVLRSHRPCAGRARYSGQGFELVYRRVEPGTPLYYMLLIILLVFVWYPGNSNGLGEIRRKELFESYSVLGLESHSVQALDHE